MVNHQTEMNSDDKQAFCVRTVILLKCLQEAGYFDSKPKGNNLDDIILSPEELYIGELLFHFQLAVPFVGGPVCLQLLVFSWGRS